MVFPHLIHQLFDNVNIIILFYLQMLLYYVIYKFNSKISQKSDFPKHMAARAVI